MDTWQNDKKRGREDPDWQMLKNHRVCKLIFEYKNNTAHQLRTDGTDTPTIPSLSSPLSSLLQRWISSNPISALPSSRYILSTNRVIRAAMANASASPGGDPPESGEGSPQAPVRDQDRFLPIANIGRIMKKALPNNAKIAKDAKETMQECVSEFVSFITSEASDRCMREKRKTINGDDLLWSMATLGFEDYLDPLKKYLTKYREMEGSIKGEDGSSFRSGGGQSSVNSLVANPGSFTPNPNYDYDYDPHLY